MENQQGTSLSYQREPFLNHLYRCVSQLMSRDCDPSFRKKLPHFPDELLLQILRCLDPLSLKNARLTCRRWSSVGAHSLFRCIYFAPRTNIMNIFTTITENPAFALNITEMVYDSRMFSSHILAPEVYEKALRHTFPPSHVFMKPNLFERLKRLINGSGGSYTPQFIRSQQRYNSLLREQADILEAKQDFAVLGAGLPCLPNLKRISVLDQFERQLDCNTWVRDNHKWYHDWSDKQFKDIVRPSSWNKTYADDDEEYTLQKYPWDSRGVNNMLKAALLYAPRLRELLIGCQNYNFPGEIYKRPSTVDTVRQLVSRLSLLKIDASGPRIADHDLDPVIRILQQSHQLEELHLSRAYYSFEALTRKWLHLRVLDLGDDFVDWKIFEAAIHNCAETLRELRLRHIHLYGKAWEDCSRDLSHCLRLRFVAIQCMKDDVASALNHEPFSFIGFSQNQLTAHRFMSAVPQINLGFASNSFRNHAVAWNKTEYISNPRVDLSGPDWNHDLPNFDS